MTRRVCSIPEVGSRQSNSSSTRSLYKKRGGNSAHFLFAVHLKCRFEAALQMLKCLGMLHDSKVHSIDHLQGMIANASLRFKTCWSTYTWQSRAHELIIWARLEAVGHSSPLRVIALFILALWNPKVIHFLLEYARYIFFKKIWLCDGIS